MQSSGSFVVAIVISAGHLRYIPRVMGSVRLLRRQFFGVPEHDVGVTQIMADITLLFRAQLRIHVVDDLLLLLFSQAGKTISVAAALLERLEILALQMVGHLYVYSLVKMRWVHIRCPRRGRNRRTGKLCKRLP